LNFFFDNILLISIAFVSGGLLIWPIVSKGIGAKILSPTQTSSLMNRENAVLIDIREKENLDLGSIPQALSVPESSLIKELGNEKFIKKLQDGKNKKKPVIIITSRRSSSASAEKVFLQNGFKEVFRFDGGVEAWIEAGLVIKKLN
tara:strand:- start:76 stop:513 length:438 start_codon:yes stop_codon:yes gene_type:complete